MALSSDDLPRPFLATRQYLWPKVKVKSTLSNKTFDPKAIDADDKTIPFPETPLFPVESEMIACDYSVF
mgnify:CR=1 FL=1